MLDPLSMIIGYTIGQRTGRSTSGINYTQNIPGVYYISVADSRDECPCGYVKGIEEEYVKELAVDTTKTPPPYVVSIDCPSCGRVLAASHHNLPNSFGDKK